MEYRVINRYEIGQASQHKTVDAALNSRDKREGDGWIVMDDDKNVWDWDFDGNPRITETL